MTIGKYPVHDGCGGALVPLPRSRRAVRPRVMRLWCGKCRTRVECSRDVVLRAESAALAEEVSTALADPRRRSRPRLLSASVPAGWDAPDFVFQEGRVAWWHWSGVGDRPSVDDPVRLGHAEFLVASAEELLADLELLCPTLTCIDAFPLSVRVSGAVETSTLMTSAADMTRMIQDVRAKAAPGAASVT